MARRVTKKQAGAMSVRLEGLARAREIPGWIERGQRETLERAGGRIRDDMAEAAPGGKGGRIGRSVRSVALSDTRLLISVEHPGGKAHARGAYIRSRRGPGTAIRFMSGGTRFVRFPRGARLKATNWDKKGLRRRRTRLQQTFDEVFGDLERSVG